MTRRPIPDRPDPALPPRQQRQPLAPQPTQQAKARLRTQLADAVDTSDAVLAEHGECDCPTCRLVSYFMGSLRLFVMLLDIT